MREQHCRNQHNPYHRQRVTKLRNTDSIPHHQLRASTPHSRILYASKMAVRLPIDDMYLPNDLIHIMLDDGMSNLKSTHSKKDELAPGWPPPDHIHQLVKCASGHVPYVSTMMKYLSRSTRCTLISYPLLPTYKGHFSFSTIRYTAAFLLYMTLSRLCAWRWDPSSVSCRNSRRL